MSILPSRKSPKKKPGDTRKPIERAYEVCEFISRGMSVNDACLNAGLDKSQLRRLREKDEALDAEIRRAHEEKIVSRVDELHTEANEVMDFARAEGKEASSYVAAFGHKIKVVQWAAEKEHPRYSPRVDIAGVDGAPLVIKIVEVTNADEQKSAWQKP